MNADDYLTAFTEHLTLTGKAKRTIETYRYNLNRFFTFVDRHYPRIRRIEQINADIIADYRKALIERRQPDGKPLSGQTMQLMLIVLKSFFHYLVTQDLLVNNPARSLVLPKDRPHIPRDVLSEQEVRQLLSGLNGNDPVSLRDRAIVELFYACGIRTTELCSLRLTDIDFQEQTATIVHGKGGKSRIVPIGQYACYYISEYLEHGRRFFLKGMRSDPGFLFLSRQGNPFNKTTINKSVMRKVEKSLEKKRHLSCYALRHAVATQLLANEVDIVYIARLLGHSSLKTTQKYAHVDISQLKRMHAKYHPRERNT